MKYVEVGNSQLKKQTKGQMITTIVILLLFGGLMLMTSVFLNGRNKKFFETAVPTMGEITKIETKGSREHRTHTVYVSYEVDGEAYEKTLGYYSSGMRVGASIEVWYQPENPGRIESKTGGGLGVWITGLAGVLSFIFVIYSIKKLVTGGIEDDAGLITGQGGMNDENKRK